MRRRGGSAIHGGVPPAGLVEAAHERERLDDAWWGWGWRRSRREMCPWHEIRDRCAGGGLAEIGGALEGGRWNWIYGGTLLLCCFI